MICQSYRTFLAAFVVCVFLPVSIWTQTTPDTIECGKIMVKDYPLPALVQTLFKTCNKQIVYTENLPEIKVTLNSTGAFPACCKMCTIGSSLNFDSFIWNLLKI